MYKENRKSEHNKEVSFVKPTRHRFQSISPSTSMEKFSYEVGIVTNKVKTGTKPLSSLQGYYHCEQMPFSREGVTPCNIIQHPDKNDQKIAPTAVEFSHARNMRERRTCSIRDTDDDVTDNFLNNYCVARLVLCCFWRCRNIFHSSVTTTKYKNISCWKTLILLFSMISTTVTIPIRWEIGSFGECSVSCGRGTQSRSVVCKNMPERDSLSSSIGSIRLPDMMCPLPKPTTTRSCSLIACTPEWRPGPWSKCSRKCGRGLQKRHISCTQRLASGATEPVPDVYCSRVRPALKRKCALLDCPPRYTTRKWSECSVTCGKGIQLREVLCSRVAAGEHFLSPVSISHCSHLVTPALQRSCKQKKCGVSTGGNGSRRMAPREPRILTVKKNFVQQQKMPKIRLVVGMKAHVIRGTTVIMRCPVYRYKKSLMYWRHDGTKIISREEDISQLPDSSLRIRSVGEEHVGQYTCVVGESEAELTLKLVQDHAEKSTRDIDSHERLLDEFHELRSRQGVELEKRRRGAERPMHLSASSGYIEHIRPVHHRVTRQRNYDLRPPTPVYITSSKDKWKEPSDSLLSDFDFSDLSSPDMFTNDRERSTPDARGENRKISILQPPRDLTFADERDIINIQPDDPKTYDREDHFAVFDLRKLSPPKILSQPTESPMQVAGDIVTYVGGELIVAEPDSVTLLCETEGYPTPTLEWLKDNEKLVVDERHIILPDHSLRMLHPVLTDSGVYTCNATNEIGSNSSSTSLNVATKPRIFSTTADFFDVESDIVEVTIGATIKARLGATIRINCKVSGFPEPHVLWTKDVAGLGEHSRILPDNSLEIEPTVEVDHGTYSCEANNPAGTDYQASVLVLLEPPHISENDKVISKLQPTELDGFPQLFLTSTRIKSYTVKMGSHVVLGCPVTGVPEPKFSWKFNGRPIKEYSRIETLLDGIAIVSNPIDRNFEGTFSCQSTNEGGTLTTSLKIILVEYSYIPGNMTTCTETCGGNGTQHSVPICVENGTKPVNDWYCSDIEKPQYQNVSCNRIDCPPRYNVGSWSPCSKTCGNGEKSRKVTCTMLKSDNIVHKVPMETCENSVDLSEQPQSKETCFVQACPVWKVGSWSQCGHKCYGRGKSIRARRLYCIDANGTKVSRFECKQPIRPRRKEFCSTSKCEPAWIAGRWSSCSHTCGKDGIKTRILSCVFRGNKWQRAGSLCSKDSRPSVTAACNRIKCPSESRTPLPISSKDTCEDKSRYCAIALSSGLCKFYKHLCCRTCG